MHRQGNNPRRFGKDLTFSPFAFQIKANLKTIIFFLFSFFYAAIIFAQEETEEKSYKRKEKGFHVGLFLGSAFANKHTVKLYDGYGYDETGKRNDFYKSLMYRRIVIDYGGGNGQPDQIAQALNVNPGEWTFDETDMPINMKYNPGFSAGMLLRYCFDKKNSIFLNASSTRFSLNGNFTIVITTPPVGPQQPGDQNIQTFSITGAEQRTSFQFAYQRMLGEDDKFNFFVEVGPVCTMTKFLKNQATINTLHIDLAAYYHWPQYAEYNSKILKGIGFGGYGGLGMNFSIASKYSLQVLYNPSFEKISIGENQKSALQHSLGLRAYYSL